MENKENFRSDNSYRARENEGRNANSSSSNKKERRSFKCELSNIFSREGNSINENSSRRISSAPVYRKHSGRFTTPDSSDEPSSNNLTMFPFDREAIDYERIQRECFEVEEEYDDDNEDYHRRRNFSYHQPNFADSEDSPLDQKIDIFQQYAIITRRESERQSKKKKKRGIAQSPVNRKHNETSVLVHEQPVASIASSPQLTSPIPDLKIEYFAKSPSLKSSSTFLRGSENQQTLDDCQQKNSTTSSFGCKNSTNALTTTASSSGAVASNACSNVNSNINGSINLTSNPMSSVCTTPRATIVVQQVRINTQFFKFPHVYETIYIIFAIGTGNIVLMKKKSVRLIEFVRTEK